VLGSPGDTRFVAFHWSPCGDEAEFDDGRSSGTAQWQGFLALVDHPAILAQLGALRSALGSPDEEATHRLLLDRKEGARAILEPRACGKLPGEQCSEVPAPPLVPTEPDTLASFFDCSGWREVQTDQEEIRRRIVHQREVIEQVVRFLDGYAG
jgi:hypothetical protein